MAFISTPNAALAELVFQWGGSVVQNTLWFERTGGYDEGDLQTLVEGLIDWWSTEMAAQLSETITLSTVRATSQDSDTSPTYEFSPTSGNVGTGDPSSVGNGQTWAIQFKTALRGRSFRGRNYIPGIALSSLSDPNTLIAAQALAFVGAYAQLLNATYVGDAIWVIVSKYEDGTPRLQGLTTNVTSVGYADLYLDSQRRRLPGRGM